MSDTNVFGDVVTEKTPSESAIKALNHPNAGGKLDDAIAYLKTQTNKWGSHGVATPCIFYNASGHTVDYVRDHSYYHGHVYDSYPHRVRNGQWGAYLHVQNPDNCPSDSVGFVVYRGKCIDTESFCKQLVGWQTTGVPLNSLAYCDILDDEASIDENVILTKMKAKNTKDCAVTKKGMATSTSYFTEADTTFYKAILTTEEAFASFT